MTMVMDIFNSRSSSSCRCWMTSLAQPRCLACLRDWPLRPWLDESCCHALRCRRCGVHRAAGSMQTPDSTRIQANGLGQGPWAATLAVCFTDIFVHCIRLAGGLDSTPRVLNWCLEGGGALFLVSSHMELGAWRSEPKSIRTSRCYARLLIV